MIFEARFSGRLPMANNVNHFLNKPVTTAILRMISAPIHGESQKHPATDTQPHLYIYKYIRKGIYSIQKKVYLSL